MGIAAFAFGVGGPAANLAGLLHMIGHSLVKSAIFFGIGRAVQQKGSQKLADISGLVASDPLLGWGIALAIGAIAGLPPFLLFASEYAVLNAAMAAQPWLAVVLAIGLVLAMTALIHTLQALCFGTATPDVAPSGSALAVLVPLWLHLAVALLLGLAMPSLFSGFLKAAAGMIG
jgi:hydrogenase-4 component F